MRFAKLWFVLLLAVLVLPVWGQTQHSVTVGFTGYVQSPTDTATSANFYRSTTSGGPYAKLNATPVPIVSAAAQFVDTAGVGGTKYFYVATAVDAGGNESTFSNEASATFLANPAAPAGVTATSK